MTSLRVLADQQRLNVFEWDIKELREVSDLGGVLYWNSFGMEGKVPNAVLRDVFETIDDWDRLKERHPEADPPPGLGDIVWDQTLSPRDWRAVERAQTLSPRRPEPPQARSTPAE